MIVSLTQNELLPIGQFNRTHGVKGELSFSLTKADLFEKLDPEHIFC
ncbi:MAG TPA: 16S rRNA processing protein RimM, partial [Porphyromonadaceae bacterium]|nr:16S rRNA processing protein RimM [Porphyromonadaceae bacterium]